MTMKVFVWTDPYEISFGNSLLVVVADSLEEAKKLAAQTPNAEVRYADPDWTPPELEEPALVSDLPWAGWYEWRE